MAINPIVYKIKGKTESRKNPFQQAHDYLNSIKDKIQRDGHLVSKEPMYFGKPKIPLSCGVVFPNINKYEYTEKGLPCTHHLFGK